MDSGVNACRSPFRCELKDHALLVDLAQTAQAEDLKSARIGEDRVGPGHELVQSAHLADEFVPGPQVEMIGVGQQDLHAEIFGQVALGEPFDRGLRADRHEDRRLDGPVRRMQQSRAGTRVRTFGDNFEGDLGQPEA